MLRLPTVLDGDFISQTAANMGKTSIDDLPSILATVTNESTMFDTHLAFLRAGANMIRTNTYRTSVYNLNHFLGINVNNSASVITKAAMAARKAVLTHHSETSNDPTNQEVFHKTRPWIVGSCGPYGASLGDGTEYTGAYAKHLSLEDLIDWHEPRVRALLDAGVDMLSLGSVPCAKEAAAFVELMRNFPSTRVWISFYCYNDRILADGSNFRKIVKHCYNRLGDQMIAIGVSCVESSLIQRGLHHGDDGHDEKLLRTAHIGLAERRSGHHRRLLRHTH
ncbi:uncharacterized protein LOC105190730 isoform X2 [Harpegnathos saltator]|uniref:uncharacterized protein LOC105190730 isoform X2 n=1 Tax=Harpegnathos saltator TaxID=610380 RepID=UPI000DBEEB3F|nr:uncharacterized protein LOC105190730 isoform X2 [Harpegnathos saltator]